MDSPLCVGFGVDTKAAGTRGGNSCSSAVTGKVSLVEQFNQGMFTVALHGAGIADAGSGINGFLRRRSINLARWVACQAGKHSLTEAPKRFGAIFNALYG